jgi:protein-disulfide isomerase
VPLLEQVLEKYPEDVKIVFKNYPLRTHRFSRKAAVAAIAAGRQGKFWAFHDLLFKDYKRLSDTKIDEIAKKLALDLEMFEKDRNAPETMWSVRRDILDGSKAGVKGTPTVFVNGRPLRKRTLRGFQTVIERELLRIRKGGQKPAS